MKLETVNNIEKIYLKNFILRIGIIFSNISIFSLILCFCGVLTFIASAFIILIGISLILLTLGSIFILVPDYWGIFSSAINSSVGINEFFFKYFYVFAGVAIAGALLSLLFLTSDKRNKHKGRVILSAAVIALAAVSVIIFAAGVIK